MSDPGRPAWHAANNGSGKRMWFVLRSTSSGPMPYEYHNDAAGRLVRYTRNGAEAKAAQLNREEG